MSAYGQQAAPVGQPDNPEAMHALAQAVTALVAFVHAEQDPQDKAVATQCLVALHKIGMAQGGGGQMQPQGSMLAQAAGQ